MRNFVIGYVVVFLATCVLCVLPSLIGGIMVGLRLKPDSTATEKTSYVKVGTAESSGRSLRELIAHLNKCGIVGDPPIQRCWGSSMVDFVNFPTEANRRISIYHFNTDRDASVWNTGVGISRKEFVLQILDISDEAWLDKLMKAFNSF